MRILQGCITGRTKRILGLKTIAHVRFRIQVWSLGFQLQVPRIRLADGL